MRNSSHTSESFHSTREENRSVGFLERLKRRPYVATTLGVVGVSSAFGFGTSVPLAIDNAAEYWKSQGSDSSIEASGGNATITEMDVTLKELCLVSYTAYVEDVKAKVEWEEGILDKERQITANMMVQNRFCQDATVGEAIVNHEEKTYDLYVNTAGDPDAIYLDTHVDFSRNGENDRPFMYSFSGSGALIPEKMFDVFVENTGLKNHKLPSVFGAVMDARDSAMLSTVILQGEQVSRDACADKVIEAALPAYKDNLLDTATTFIESAFPEFEEYEKSVYIGAQTPDDPDRKIDFDFKDSIPAQLMNAKIDGDVELDSGVMGECEVANNVVVGTEGVL